VIHQVVRDGGGKDKYPILTKSNYYSWAALMKLKLQARGWWEAVTIGTADFIEDRNALEAITLGVPEELHDSIARKPTAKAAWEALKKVHLGVDRVRQAKANTLRREFEALRFKDGESVDDFAVRITDLATQLEVLDAGYAEPEVVRKFLQATPSRYAQIVMAIETLLDLDALSVDELVGRLKAAEERYDLTGTPGGPIARLNLSEEELVARVASRLQLSGEGTAVGRRPQSSTSRRGRGGASSQGRVGQSHGGGGQSGASHGGGSGGGPKTAASSGGKNKKKLVATSAPTAATRGTGPVSAARRSVMNMPTQLKQRRRLH